MGAGASIQGSLLKTEIDRLRERDLDTQEFNAKEWDKEELRVISKLSQLESERNELAQRLANVEMLLTQQQEGWRKEKEKTMALTYSSLPLALLSAEDMGLLKRKSKLPITRKFPMVTVAQSDVVGFSQLVERLKPKEMIRIIDHLQALMDEAYHMEGVFIMDRNSDGCLAAAGLAETLREERYLRDDSASSLADSSYGSDNQLQEFGKHSPYKKKRQNKESSCKDASHTASYYASQLATAVLKLMSSSSKVHVPILGKKQVQLRVALHSGPCTGGVLGLQTAHGANRIPQFKLLGETVQHTSSLCHTGLALQIRVSKVCKELLSHVGHDEFQFERCPDYQARASSKPIESYWLVGRKSLPIKLPSLVLAIPLSEYQDII